MSSTITYRERSSITPEEARNVRARVWRYVFECYARQKAAPPSGPNDPKGDQGERVKDIVC